MRRTVMGASYLIRSIFPDGSAAQRRVPRGGLDALTLAATILTVVLIDHGAFDEVFRDGVEVNAEGITVSDDQGNSTGHGIPFSKQTSTGRLSGKPMASLLPHASRSRGATGSPCWPGRQVASYSDRVRWLSAIQ